MQQRNQVTGTLRLYIGGEEVQGTVTLNPEPSDRLLALSLTPALTAFSEWLDGQGLIVGGDERSHEDLAREFTARRATS